MVKLPTVFWLLAAATASTEAWKCWMEEGYAYYGNNLQGMPVYQPSKFACQQACAEHDGCSYWTWDWGWASGSCYLKMSNAGRQTSDNYVSGTKDCNAPEEKG